ncbi:PREDICTED: major royal jelly protein 1-like [Vollenhovia emeryi]|uniref:major royal jelly protein 1-like n=1 Tax=Vollenhovia emeryi TaxID=411798 RepID=UPI0005F488DB|nr:PREDICTED: major royal jelly protein 1-like [Vollenhovia emeryi]
MGFSKMSLEYEWKYFDILWESPQQKQEAIDSGVYYENATGAFLHGVDKAPDGRIFVTAIKDKGMPVSVMTITEKLGKGGPLLRPYPDWSWYKNETDCNSIVSDVYQVDIKCNHLFFMDSGKRGLDYLCSPKLFIFDLSTDKLVKRVPIPNKIAHIAGIGILTTVFVYAPDCTNIKDNAIVFIGDVEKANLIVYNARSSQMCSLNATSETTKEHMVRRITFPYIDNTFCMTVIGES